MGPRRASIERRSRSARRDGQSAVSPIIGSVLILAITVLGIAGVLYWGAPMIERIQSRNAQTAMVGEFEDLRDSGRELSVPDHSRFPTVVIARGQISLQAGSRIMVTADHDAGFTGCDFRVTDWSDSGANKGTATIGTSGCRSSGVSLQVASVSGATVSQVYSGGVGATVSPAGADFSKGDWMFRLTDGASSPTVYAEAWIVTSDDVAWGADSSTGHRDVTLDAGAIFSQADGTIFLEKPSVIGDTPFGTGYYGLWMRTLTAASYSSITGAGSHQVYLSLIGNYGRVDTSNVYRLRYDVSGALAQSWCNGLINRNASLAGQSPPAFYASQVASCATLPGADSAGVRSVCYAKVAANPCTTVGPSFTFRFLHARIYTSLAA